MLPTMTTPPTPTIKVGVGGERLFAGLIMAALLVHLPGLALVPIAVIPALFLAVPLIWSADSVVRRIAGVAAAAAIAGLLLRFFVSHNLGDVAVWGSVLLWLCATPVLVAAAGWALKRIKLRTGILLALAGGIISTALNIGLEWKGTLGIFATGFVLVLLARRPLLSLAALAGVTFASFVNDARSMAVAGAAAFVLMLIVQGRQRGGLARTVKVLVATVVLGGALLWVLTSGLAGTQVQIRTLDQLSRANVLFGFRAEWAVTLSLFQSQPLGFGVGATPSDAQAGAGVAAVQAAGGDYLSRYFSDIVLGDRVDLHSTTANLWFHFGVVGVVLALLLAVVLFRGVRDYGPSAGTLGVGGMFLILMSAWDLLFSPMADVDRLIIGILIALAVTGRAARSREEISSLQASAESPLRQRRLSRSR